jgi:hypothetical protein
MRNENQSTFIIISVFVIILSGCVKKTAGDLIVDAVEIASVNIDSANLILNKISDPELLTDDQQYQYNRLKVQHMINYSMKWDSIDSLNNIVIKYCLQKNDTTKLIPALYNAGWISLNMNKADKAVEQYLGLKKIGEEQQSNSVMRHCCYYLSIAYLEKKDNENALFFAKERLNYLEHDTVSKAGGYYFVASLYKQMNEVDSALHYFNNCLALYDKTSVNKYYISHVFNEISDLLLKNDNYKEALRYVELSLQYRSKREDISFFNLTKARAFMAGNMTDSAKIYLKIAIESSDNEYISIIAYNHLADLFKNDGDYRNAFLRRLSQRDVFESSERSLEYDVMHQKYKEEILKNENNELRLAKNEQEILFLSIALVSLIVIVSLWVYVLEDRKRKKNKEQVLREEALLAKSQLVENENKILKKDNELILLKEKSAILRESLFRKMAVARKIPSLTKTEENTNSAGKIYMEESDWDELINTTNELFDGFSSLLRKEYPTLSNEDVGFCCLVKINVSIQDLADIYCISKAGIIKKKYRLKKYKFNIHDENISLDDFLASL